MVEHEDNTSTSVLENAFGMILFCTALYGGDAEWQPFPTLNLGSVSIVVDTEMQSQA